MNTTTETKKARRPYLRVIRIEVTKPNGAPLYLSRMLDYAGTLTECETESSAPVFDVPTAKDLSTVKRLANSLIMRTSKACRRLEGTLFSEGFGTSKPYTNAVLKFVKGRTEVNP